MLKGIKRGALLVALIGAFLAGAWVWDWFNPPLTTTIVRTVEKPYKAPVSPLLKKVEKGVVEGCPEIVALKPTSPQIEAIEKKVGAPIPPGDLLTLREVNPLPYGGRLFVTLPPPSSEGDTSPREVEVVVVPKPPPFFEWLGEREVSLLAGRDQDGQGAVSLDLDWRLFRTGPVVWKGRAGTIGTLTDQHYYVMVGGSIRF